MIALLKMKLSKLSSYSRKLSSDTDLIKALGNIKDQKQLESQKELMLIKEIKKNLSEQLMKIYLPNGFAEFYTHIESLSYYDKPDYDKLIKILEKAKESIPFYAKMKTNTCVDQDLFDNDPLFVKFQE